MFKYILWRITIMIPTMLIISVLVFTIIQLPPGDYLVAAINADQVPEARDAQFYEALSRAATLVSIGAGEKKSIDLKVSSIR